MASRAWCERRRYCFPVSGLHPLGTVEKNQKMSHVGTARSAAQHSTADAALRAKVSFRAPSPLAFFQLGT
jgi:hypothetical protein